MVDAIQNEVEHASALNANSSKGDFSAPFFCKNRYSIFNTYVNALSLDESIDEIESLIKKGDPVQHVVINASKINLMRDDDNLVSIINSCPLINADGASIVWAAKKLGVPLKERVTGIDLFLRLIEVAAEKGYKVYLFGAKEEIVLRVKSIFEKEYPSLEIVGTRNGYFSVEDEPRIVADMANSGADMMFVAFSSPKKEYWVNRYLSDLNIPFVMGVGGSFDIVAGETSRAPLWMQNCGLEWFYRFIQEPGRLWKRYILGNARFIEYTYKTRLRFRKDAGQND